MSDLSTIVSSSTQTTMSVSTVPQSSLATDTPTSSTTVSRCSTCESQSAASSALSSQLSSSRISSVPPRLTLHLRLLVSYLLALHHRLIALRRLDSVVTDL